MTLSRFFRSRLSVSLLCAALFGASPALAATTHVTSLADSGPGSLRDAIVNAAPGDTIDFSVTGTITLTSGELLISKNLTISGPGASTLAISGNNSSRVFNIGTVAVAISDLTIQDGRDGYGGGIINYGTLTVSNSTLSGNSATSNTTGGGIVNGGTLTLTNSTLSGNSATDGAGIANAGTLTVIHSTLSGNSASDLGGGIFNYGTVIVTNSTLSGNSGPGRGGGIFNLPPGTVTVTNSTLSGNSANGGNAGGGGICNAGRMTVTNSTLSGNLAIAAYGSLYGGGGIFNQDTGTLTVTNSTLSGNSANRPGGGIYNWYGSITLKNTIVANSPLGGNCSWTPLSSQGHNLSDDTSCADSFNQIGDMNSTPALLDPSGLQDNGGPTKTIALLASSLAVDAIPVSDCTDVNSVAVTTDQRGVARPQGPACDIGAFELALQQVNQPPVANAGPDQTVIVGEVVTFDGSGSSDPDGTIASYGWNFGDNTTDSGPVATKAYSTAGNYSVVLTVTDNEGASSTDTATVTVLTSGQAIQSLASIVQSFNLQQGIANSLDAKIQNALDAMTAANAGVRSDAANKLAAFINSVEAQRGKELTSAQADTLEALARRILAVI